MIVSVPDFTVDVIQQRGRNFIDANDLRHWLAEASLGNDDKAVKIFIQILRNSLSRIS